MPLGEDYWYTNQPLGHCTLDSTVKRMCEQAGIPGYRTNHSLRATAATRLHQSGCVEEQEIMQRTGHRSIEAVRSYKWTSSEQLEQVSDILNNDNNAKKYVARHCHSTFSSTTLRYFLWNVEMMSLQSLTFLLAQL